MKTNFLLPDKDEPWPHQFVKNGRGYEIGVDELGFPKYAQTYICVHCYEEYVNGFQDPLPNPCPARSTKKELKRILLT